MSTIAARPQPSRREITIRVLRNGDARFKGVYIDLVVNKLNGLTTLLSFVTEEVEDKTFVPKQISTLYKMDGSEVQTTVDLEDGVTYVAACPDEGFRTNVCYPKEVRPASAISKVTTVPSRILKAPTFKPRRVTIVRDGHRPRRMFSFPLNSRTASTFEHVLSTISEEIQLDGGPLHTLLSPSGEAVSQIGTLFGKDRVFFAFTKKLKYRDSDWTLDQTELEEFNKLNMMPPHEELKVADILPSSNAAPPQMRMKYKIHEKIGYGPNATVYTCSVRYSRDTLRYAMKVITKTEDNYETLRNEINMLKALRHPNILRLMTVFDDTARVYLVLDLQTDGTLYAAIKRGRIADDEAKWFIANLASALDHLHAMFIVHRDVRPTAMMITRNIRDERSLMLCDFTLAIQTPKPLYSACGSTFFMSPEMLYHTGYNQKHDVWASGIVLYSMLTQTCPFLGNDEEEDRRLIMAGKINVEAPEWTLLPPGARDLIEHMLCVEVDNRYSTEEVLNHPWITGSEFEMGDDEGDGMTAWYDEALDREIAEHGDSRRFVRIDDDRNQRQERTHKVGDAGAKGDDEGLEDEALDLRVAEYRDGRWVTRIPDSYFQSQEQKLDVGDAGAYGDGEEREDEALDREVAEHGDGWRLYCQSQEQKLDVSDAGAYGDNEEREDEALDREVAEHGDCQRFIRIYCPGHAKYLLEKEQKVVKTGAETDEESDEGWEDAADD